MGVNYSALEKTARRLIKENGRSMVIRTLVKSGPAHNPVITPSDESIIGVMTEFKNHERDDSVQRGDKKVIVASGFEINTTMRLVDDSLEYSIIDVLTIKPGTKVIIYILQARI